VTRVRVRRDAAQPTPRPPAERPPRDPHRSIPRPTSRAGYRRRRLAALLIGLLLLVGLGLTGRVLLYDVGLADVEQAQVTGTVAVPVPDVLAAAGVTLGAPLASVDTDAIAQRVAQLPPVESVRVGRSWPHTVTIEITERVPVATVQTTQGPSLVDRYGVVYGGPAVTGLPRLIGSFASGSPNTLAAVGVLGALPEPVRSQLEAVRASTGVTGAPPQVVLELTDGREVRWGAHERAAEKAGVLVPLLTRPGRVFDVASPDLPTVRP
jgi:cell division protein FtsQ